MIDLRSDTVTRPDRAMREAIAAAPVGDDVWGDDPSVIVLQERIADEAGFPAALFFPSATQANLAALMTHGQRGDEFIAGQQSHLYKYEGGGGAVLAGLQPQPLEQEADGTFCLARIEAAIKADDIHFARTRLIALENTFQGLVLPADYTARVTRLAAARGLATHLDGARLFNAAVASGQSLANLCRDFGSVSLCFSKGLGAPVGAVLLGDAALIDRARRWRKTLGGGMRQAGLLAAGCLHALDHNVARLAEDHANARRLAEGLAAIAGIEGVECATNMVHVRFPESRRGGLTAALRDQGILAECLPRTRFVTHRDVSVADIERVIAVVAGHLRAGH